MFSDNFYPELSGISDSLISTAQNLVKLNHKVDFYVPEYSKKDFLAYNVSPEELNLDENIKIHRFSSIGYPFSTGQSRLVIPTFLRWLLIGKNKPDIIHTHLIFGVGLEALSASKFLKIPLVGTNHTPIVEFIKYTPLKIKFAENLALRFVSWYYNHCEFVSAPSQSIIVEMQKNGFKKPNKVISNPVDLQSFKPASSLERSQTKKEFNLSNFTVLYTGRLAIEKHVDVVIRSITIAKEKIPHINFAITGHGFFEDSLKRLVKELKLENNVKFFGTLKMLDYAKIYRAADIFAIASTAETQSLSLMKAMATGIPVIGVNAWALPEYINKENGYVVEPGDYKAMAEKIIFLYNNPQKRSMLGKGGLKTVKNFSPSIISSLWSDIYKDIYSKFYKKN